MSAIRKLLRDNIRALKPYSSARNEFSGSASVFLDANENSYGSPNEQSLNRYPDPLQRKLRAEIAQVKSVAEENIFLGNGSDEAIDLLIRAFCEPHRDSILITPPTYGMYRVSADINAVTVIESPLMPDFSLNAAAVLDQCTANTKLVFLCSPNNPSGNLLDVKAVTRILNNFPGIVVVDEAYADFSEAGSWTQQIANYPRLVVMQTFSKAWGMAAARLGMAFSDAEIITVLNAVKPPYTINQLSADYVYNALGKPQWRDQKISQIHAGRKMLSEQLEQINSVQQVFPSQANFLLVRFDDARAIYRFLADRGIIVRDRSTQLHCENCLRITVGTEAENNAVLSTLEEYEKSTVH